MQQITFNNYLLQEVPEGSYDHTVYPDGLLDYFKFQTTCVGEVALPSGSWSVIGMADKLTEEQWSDIVSYYEWLFPERHNRWIDYTCYNGEKQKWNDGLKDAISSGLSLLWQNDLLPHSDIRVGDKINKMQELFPNFKLESHHIEWLNGYHKVSGFEPMYQETVFNEADFETLIEMNLRWLKDYHEETERAVEKLIINFHKQV